MAAANMRAPPIALAAAALFGLSTPFAKVLIGNVNHGFLPGFSI